MAFAMMPPSLQGIRQWQFLWMILGLKINIIFEQKLKFLNNLTKTVSYTSAVM